MISDWRLLLNIFLVLVNWLTIVSFQWNLKGGFFSVLKDRSYRNSY